MAQRKLLGQNLSTEDRIVLAQLTQLPGWQVLVKIMAEACRNATEEVIKLDAGAERYQEKLMAMQISARAINKFSADVLDSVKVSHEAALRAVTPGEETPQKTGRFEGFKPPTANESPTEGEQ